MPVQIRMYMRFWRQTMNEYIEEDENTEEDEEYNDPYFDNICCTCEHEEEEHGWQGCEVKGCPCEAGWIE